MEKLYRELTMCIVIKIRFVEFAISLILFSSLCFKPRLHVGHFYSH